MGTEIDPPLVEVLKKKPGQRFASVRRGVDAAQVDAFLVKIASRIDALEAELQGVPVTPEVQPEGTGLTVPYFPVEAEEGSGERYSERIARLGMVGVREVEKMLAEAKAEAATIVSEAKGEADRITNDAQSEATRSVDDARAYLSQVEEDARKIPSDAAERRRRMIEEMRTMQESLQSIAKDLDMAVNPEGRDADRSGRSPTIETGPGS
jgi:vacuolar-type H+-ATPase subunit H